MATHTREEIDLLAYSITNGIRDNLSENAYQQKLLDALRIDTSKGPLAKNALSSFRERFHSHSQFIISN